MKTAIIANGEINDYAAVREKIADVDYLIACDGGLRHFPALGLAPHCLIGDFDSAPPELLAAYRSHGTPIIPFPAEKDETDLALALAHVMTKAPASIIILGALGGRLDHALANMHVLAQAGDIPSEIWDENTSVMLISPQAKTAATHIPRENYATLSLIPLTTEATGIITRGLAYPLKGETLRAGESRGVSNTFTADTAEITVESGLLLAIRCK